MTATRINRGEGLAERLAEAISHLTDDNGFVLVATTETCAFTPIRAGGYDDWNELSIPELEAEDAERRLTRIRSEISSKQRDLNVLNAEIQEQARRLDDLHRAIAQATGRAS